MKKHLFSILVVCLSSCAALAFGGTCEDASKVAVYIRYPEYFMSKSGAMKRILDIAECTKQARTNVCDVSGDNQEGAGDIYFQVVLDEKCEQVVSVSLTGEE